VSLKSDEVLFLVDGVGHKRHKARAFDAFGEQALVFGAGAGFSRRIHLGLHGDELSQESRVFVVHPLNIVGAEITGLFFRLEFFLRS